MYNQLKLATDGSKFFFLLAKKRVLRYITL